VAHLKSEALCENKIRIAGKIAIPLL
jgi:hypothetical protein